MHCPLDCPCRTSDMIVPCPLDHRPSHRFDARYRLGGRLGAYRFPRAYRVAIAVHTNAGERAAAFDRITDAIRAREAGQHRW